MATSVKGGDSCTNISASALIKTGAGSLIGIFVASASSTPTIKVWDNSAASGKIIVNTFTPIGGSWYPMPFEFGKGLYVTISGTVDCSVSYN